MFPNCLQRLRDFELRHNPMVVFKPRVELAFAFRSLWHCQCSLVKLLIMMQATLPTGHQFHASLKFRPQPNIFQSDGNNSGAHTCLCSYSALYTVCFESQFEQPPIRISLGAQPWYRFFVLQSKCRNFISSIGQNRAGTIWRGSFRRWLRI